MKIGFDFGGVIDTHPQAMSLIAKGFKLLGAEIHIISAVDYIHPMYDTFPGATREEKARNSRAEAIKGYGVDYDVLFISDTGDEISADRHKGKYCAENGIDVMFEDLDKYIEDIQKHSPNTKIIRVV